MVKEAAGRNFAILTQKYSNKIKQILIRRLKANFNFDKHLTKEFANLYYKKNSTVFTSYCIYFYYIHTEKYSLKSYVVIFRTQISSSQSEERTMVFTREKK